MWGNIVKYTYTIALAIGCLMPTIAQSMDNSFEVEKAIKIGNKTALKEHVRTLKESPEGKRALASNIRNWLETAQRLQGKEGSVIDGEVSRSSTTATGYVGGTVLTVGGGAGAYHYWPSEQERATGGACGGYGKSMASGAASALGLAILADTELNRRVLPKSQKKKKQYNAIVAYLQEEQRSLPTSSITRLARSTRTKAELGREIEILTAKLAALKK